MISNGSSINKRNLHIKNRKFSICSYHEVFNTFISFGFVWQDKEFRLAKLKANYIYERYMSTSDAIARA